MKLLNEFREFAIKGNVVDLAVGVIIGAAFNKIVESLVGDVVMPIIGRIVGKLDFSNLFVRCRVNGTVCQDSSTRDLIFPVPALVAFISAIMTLLPGDIISTGTPAGIGPLAPGDSVSIEVEGVGELVNPVEAGL